MKRAQIVEDWSRFNRAVLDVADGVPQRVASKQYAPQQAKRNATELVPDPGESGDTYGVISRNKWRKHA